MKAALLNFSTDQRRVFVVLRWHSVTTHGIEDAEMFRYKQTTRPDFAQQIAYSVELEARDTRTLGDYIREYNVAGKIMPPGVGGRVEI